MRLIPGKTKVKIELFRGITLSDIIVGAVTLALVSLVFMSTIPGNIYIASGILAVGGLMLLRMDGKPIYVMFLGLLRFLAYPKLYKRSTTDKELLPSALSRFVISFFTESFS